VIGKELLSRSRATVSNICFLQKSVSGEVTQDLAVLDISNPNLNHYFVQVVLYVGGCAK